VGLAAQQFRALVDGVFDMAVDDGTLRATDQGADNGVGLARISVLQAFGDRDEAFAERVKYRLLNENPRIGHADLSLVEEDAERGRPHGVVDIRIA
jgi:hypothetical protein